MKSGWKTTEFWVTLATVLCGILATVLSPEQGSVLSAHADKLGAWSTIVAQVAAGFATVAYTVSRTWHKNTVTDE